jgi:hypothetical protein
MRKGRETLSEVWNAVFWDVTPYGMWLRSVRRLLVTANVLPSSPILVSTQILRLVGTLYTALLWLRTGSNGSPVRSQQ